MRKILIYIALMLTGTFAWTQDGKSERKHQAVNRFYGGIDAGIVLNKNARLLTSLGIHKDLYQSYGLTLDFEHFNTGAVNAPEHYGPGLVLFGNGKPIDRNFFFNIRATKTISINNKLFAVLEAGPTLFKMNRANFVENPDGGWFSPSHYVFYNHTYHTGLSMSVRLIAPISKRWGFALLARSNLNAFQSFSAFGLGLVYGRLL